MIRCGVKIRCFLSVPLILITTACTHWVPRVNQFGFPEQEYLYQEPEEIANEWETTSIKEVNISQDKLNEMMHDILGGNDRNIHSILIVKNGKLVFWNKVELKPSSEMQFFGDSKRVGKFYITFIADQRGEVNQFMAYLDFRGFKFDKID
jgi:hypothetical protein